MLKGKLNVAKRPDVREKLRKNHWSKTKIIEHPKSMLGKHHSEESKKLIGKRTKGKTYEELYGKEKAAELKYKRSESMKRPKTNKEKENMSIARKGKYKREKNPAWKGGKSFELYGEDFTEELRTSIRKRDKFVCKICKKNGWCIHHIDYNKKNNDSKNLITLCNKCHGLTGFNRKKWMRFFIQ